MRPKSIILFAWLYLAAVGIGLLNSIVYFDQIMATAMADPRVRMFPPEFFRASLYVSTAIGLLVAFLLWFFITRRPSLLAKWIFVLLTAVAVLGLIGSVVSHRFPPGIPGVLSAVGCLLRLASAWMLFRPDANAWFGDKGIASEP